MHLPCLGSYLYPPEEKFIRSAGGLFGVALIFRSRSLDIHLGQVDREMPGNASVTFTAGACILALSISRNERLQSDKEHHDMPQSEFFPGKHPP